LTVCDCSTPISVGGPFSPLLPARAQWRGNLLDARLCDLLAVASRERKAPSGRKAQTDHNNCHRIAGNVASALGHGELRHFCEGVQGGRAPGPHFQTTAPVNEVYVGVSRISRSFRCSRVRYRRRRQRPRRARVACQNGSTCSPEPTAPSLLNPSSAMCVSTCLESRHRVFVQNLGFERSISDIFAVGRTNLCVAGRCGVLSVERAVD
jgi:hypothetical protein